MKKIMIFVFTVLLICTAFLGCDLLEPKEELEKVRLSKDYPEDDLPLYDDAFVYDSDDDDESVSVKYASEDDIDDVVDFYTDLFEDNEIALTDESDKSSRYTAEGSYKDFTFEIKVTEAGDDYAGDYKTLVRIEIEFLDESIPPPSLEQQLIGFWREENMDDGTSSLETDTGSALRFLDDGTVEVYDNYEYTETLSWAVADETSVALTSKDGTDMSYPARIEERDSTTYLIWGKSDDRAFYKGNTDGFTLFDPNAPDPDADLKAAITGKTWYFVHYFDGSDAYTDAIGYCIYNSDGTFEDEYSGVLETGTWYIKDNRLYCTYADGTTSDWAVEVICDSGVCELYYYADNPNEYWLYSEKEPEQPAEKSPIADVGWYAYYSAGTDGAKDYFTDTEEMSFYSDGVFKYYHADGSIVDGTWEMSDNVLTINYASGTTASWTAEIEYLFGINTLYLTDTHGYEWTYTDIDLTGGTVRIPNERASGAITGIMFDSVHYVYADGSTEGMTETHIIFNEDGSLNEMYGETPYTGTWSFTNAILHIEYIEDSEIHDYPDSYIEFDPASGTMTLYIGDDQAGFEGGHWLFRTNPI